MKFQDFRLDERLLNAVQKNKFTQPTPVQEQAIPPALKGQDVIACAQTGTGKTAAFVLPLLHRLLNTKAAGHPRGKGPRVLVLTPTRELAAQALENIRLFGGKLPIRAGMVVGGVSYGPQIKLLSQPLDILVATPGRLIDHMNERRVAFDRIETLVLDEADRMLDMGFLAPIEKIVSRTPQNRQTLLFSATYSKEIEKVSHRFLKDPVQISLAPKTQNHESITQQIVSAKDKEHKFSLLTEILQDQKVWQAIVFIKTKHGADKMAKKLSKMGHETAALHGNMRQSARDRVIGRMHKGSVRVLVATDVAARGLDVKDLSHVINFDLPQVAEDYIHRIGRTGRAGAEGTAISLVAPQDRSLLRDIERLIGRRLGLDGEDASRQPQRSRKKKNHSPRKNFAARASAAKKQRSRGGYARASA